MEKGEVVVTWDEDLTQILAVTRQDEEGRVLSVIAMAPGAEPTLQDDVDQNQLELMLEQTDSALIKEQGGADNRARGISRSSFDGRSFGLGKSDHLRPTTSGFYKLPERPEVCRHEEHNPPMYISIPKGHGYRHVCPGCGQSVDIIRYDDPMMGHPGLKVLGAELEC